MKAIARIVIVAALITCAAPGAAADRNWTAPKQKIYAQRLCEQTMAKHPELLSVTLHGVPPGMSEVYTMFAGSFPDRIGNADDPDDIDVTKKGITILDPRWHRTKDDPKKFVILMPMRDAKGENIGLVVYAWKNPPAESNVSKVEAGYLAKANVLRDELATKIPSYKVLFDPAR